MIKLMFHGFFFFYLYSAMSPTLLSSDYGYAIWI